ncbi:hypothetical protein SCACP_09940 [Sporomusa carbonis]|uniref:hypothetical protein n=1 Tax=Sporomusa carbonis TaxID=3076075 RepID=UPI003A69056B
MKQVAETDTILQLNEVIEQYHSSLLFLRERYYASDVRVQYFKSMLEALTCCRQYLIFERRMVNSGLKDDYRFSWFITFVFFPAAFNCIERSLGLVSRDWEGATKKAEYTQSISMLYSIRSRLLRQQGHFEESGKIELTTYQGQPFVFTYGGTVELVNSELLFRILKDLGALFSELKTKEFGQPVKYSSAL